MKEKWASIPGLPNYEASTSGQIRSMKSGRGVINEPGHIMSGCPDQKGYLLVNCRVGHKSRTQRVHRLIARTFIGEIPDGFQINHMNGVKDDNRLTNLEIVSPGQNLKHRHDVLKIKINWRGSNHGKAKLNEPSVMEIRRRYAKGELQKTLAKEFGVSTPTIAFVVNRKTWTHI